jgi:hypothetical protein
MNRPVPRGPAYAVIVAVVAPCLLVFAAMFGLLVLTLVAR